MPSAQVMEWRSLVAVLAALTATVGLTAPVAASTSGRATRALSTEDPAFVAPDFVTSWSDGALDVAVAPNGDVVTASGSAAVSRYSAFGELLHSWSVPPGSSAYHVAVAPDDNVWVTTSASTILEYTPEGELLGDWGPNDLGSILSPSDIAVDAQSHPIVLSALGGLIEFDQDMHKVRGNSANVFQGNGGLLGMGIGPDGQVDVGTAVDQVTGHPDIVRVAADWRSRTLTFGTFSWPQSMAFDVDGTEYVADALDADRIAVFRDGAPIGVIGGPGTGPGQFADPAGVAVSPTTGDLYVADDGNDRIQVFGDSADPSVSVTVPADGATYTAGEALMADYACAPGPQGTAIASCSADVDDGALLDTSGIGERTFTVTAVDELGRTATGTVTYTLTDDQPAIDLRTPSDGAAFAIGQSVAADYSCSDAGTGLASCTGSVPDGDALDTTTPGPHEFTVTAADVGTNTNEVTHTYTVGGQARPDGLVRAGVQGTERGDDVYDPPGAGQTVGRRGGRGQTISYFLRLQNDAPYPDALRLTAPASANGYRVTYRSLGDDVTAPVVDGSFTTTTLAPGESILVKATVQVTGRAAVGSRFVGSATVRSTEPGAPTDRVVFIAQRR